MEKAMETKMKKMSRWEAGDESVDVSWDSGRQEARVVTGSVWSVSNGRVAKERFWRRQDTFLALDQRGGAFSGSAVSHTPLPQTSQTETMPGFGSKAPERRGKNQFIQHQQQQSATADRRHAVVPVATGSSLEDRHGISTLRWDHPQQHLVHAARGIRPA
jgi:hypothetical protein